MHAKHTSQINSLFIHFSRCCWLKLQWRTRCQAVYSVHSAHWCWYDHDAPAVTANVNTRCSPSSQGRPLIDMDLSSNTHFSVWIFIIMMPLKYWTRPVHRAWIDPAALVLHVFGTRLVYSLHASQYGIWYSGKSRSLIITWHILPYSSSRQDAHVYWAWIFHAW